MSSALLITTDPNAQDEATAAGGMGWTTDLTMLPAGDQAPGVLITGGNPFSTQYLPLPVDPQNVASIMATLDAQEKAAPPVPTPVQQLATILVNANVLTPAQVATILNPQAAPTGPTGGSTPIA